MKLVVNGAVENNDFEGIRYEASLPTKTIWP